MKLLFFVVLLLSPGVFADQVLNVNIPGGGASDLLNMTKVPADISNTEPDQSVVRSCVNAQGRQVFQADPEYKKCLAEAQRKKPTKP